MRSFAPLVFLLLLAVTFGCAAQSGQQSRNVKPDPYEGIIAQRCAACHDLTLVEKAHETKTNAEMRDPESSKEGYGEGSFVVVRGEKVIESQDRT